MLIESIYIILKIIIITRCHNSTFSKMNTFHISRSLNYYYFLTTKARVH